MAFRSPNTTRQGGSFSESIKIATWNKAHTILGINPGIRRIDACGAPIDWSQFGNTTEGGTGWEIDHIIPVAQEGGDEISNLQPLQWQNNRCKSDSLTNAYCVMPKNRG